MPDPSDPALSQIVAEVLARPGLVWLVLATALAGMVRGFSGFGTALVYVPVAGQMMPPVWVVITLVVMDIVGPVPNLPRAARDGRMGEVAWMVLGMLLALPLGLMVLQAVPEEVFRYAVSGLALVVPVLLAAGLRYRGAMGPGMLGATGAVSGFVGGAAGLPGPPVILLYMASTRAVRVIRANTMIYLFCFDLSLLAVLALQGRLMALPLVLGAVLILPNLAGNMAGAAIFRPERERHYRVAAYVVIAAAALSGLPLWD